MSSLNFKIIVNVLGAVVLLAHMSIALLSYVQTPVLWQKEHSPRAAAFFESFDSGFPVGSTSRDLLLTARSIIPEGEFATLPSFIPLAIATFASLALYLVFLKKGDQSGPGQERLLLRWSIAFAAASFLAYPIFTQDFWLSAVWGRMVINGQNPYYVLFGDGELANLPLDHFPMPMTYGPLWALLSGAVMAAFDCCIWGIFLAFKLLLTALWLSALYMVSRLTAHLPPRERALAIIIFGWLPSSVFQTIAEGHNDIALAALALVWLYFLTRNTHAAPFALVTSALCKYGSAPLFLLDLIYSLSVNRMSVRSYVLRLALPALISVLLFAIYFRSANFFDGLLELSTWKALRTVDAIVAVENLSGLPLAAFQFAAVAFFPIFAAYKLYWLMREPGENSACETALAIMCAVIFSGVSHLWPWYLIWPLAFAALTPGWWLSRFVTGVAIIAPFALAFWWIARLENHKDIAALIMYLGAVAWVFATRNAVSETPAQTATTISSLARSPMTAADQLNRQPSPK